MGHLNCVFQKNRAPFSILDKCNENVRDLFNTLDLVRSSLHRESVGAVRKSAPIIEVEHESLFWEMKLLGYSSPRILQNTVFFYVRFPPDTTVYNSCVFYEYTEYISKNNQHRFKDINMQNKVGRAYARVDSERCIVKLLDKYLVKLTPNSPTCTCVPLRRFQKNPSRGIVNNESA